MGATFLKSSCIGLALIVLSSCGKSNSPTNSDGNIASNIVGGAVSTDAFQKENGIVGLVIVRETGAGICTGTLIHRRIVLTAAHCLDNRTGTIKQLAVVFASDLKKAAKEQVRAGVRGQSHENFAQASFGGSSSWDDVALVKLNEDAPADFNVATLASSGFLNSLSANTKAIQTGFGRTVASNAPADNPPESDATGVLRQVEGIQILGMTADSKELHFKEENKGSCKGDSGGPAFVRNSAGKLVQIGINSRGNNTNNCLEVGIYTSVEAQLQWINSNAQALLSSN